MMNYISYLSKLIAGLLATLAVDLGLEPVILNSGPEWVSTLINLLVVGVAIYFAPANKPLNN